jgi:protein TonB
MLPQSHFTKFLVISLACHILGLAAAVYLIKPALTPLPTTIPVEIVNIPRERLKQLPPVAQPLPPRPAPRTPIIPLPEPQPKLPAVPAPKQFGNAPDIAIPKTLPPSGKPGTPSGGEQGTGSGKTAPKEGEPGPLPFLSQSDIDDLASKGFPKNKLQDEPLKEETEAYSSYSYERWLFPTLSKNMRFPELAAITGLQGNVFIIFEILKDGSLGKIEIVKSSGYKILDDEAVRTVRDSAPFQPLPPEWNKDSYLVHGVAIFRNYERYMR